MPCIEEGMVNYKNNLVTVFSPISFVFKWDWNFLGKCFECFLSEMEYYENCSQARFIYFKLKAHE